MSESGQAIAGALGDRRSIETLLSFLVLVIGWSLIRPNMVRDYDNRALPYNTTARIAFTLAFAIAFMSLALGYAMFIGAAESVFTTILPNGKGFFETFKGQPAMLAMLTLGLLLQFSMFRDLERSTLVWLHSRRHMSDDFNKLWHHLDDGPFSPSPQERQKNREAVKKYGIYVTDEGLNAVGLVTFNKWEKTCTLLRLVSAWNDTEETRVLGDEDMKLLKDLQTSHDRKSELAMTILKMVDEVQVQHSAEAEKALSAMLKVLSDTPHIDRESVAAAEARAKVIITGSVEDLSKKQLRLTGEQLRNRIVQIERYFEVEYQIMLEQVSQLASRTVVLSGDKANDRLEQLKAAGVGGLGSIQQFNFDRILWMFLVVSLGGFLVLYLGYSKTMQPGMAEGLARFSFAMAIAALIGAVVGSRRRHSNAVQTPWLKYVTGGVMAGLCFIVVSVIWNGIKVTLGIPQPEGQPPFSVYRMLPWALLPCITTIAIARLARMAHWPELPRSAGYRWLYVRILDGICVSLALFLAYCMAFSLHDLMGIALSPGLKALQASAWLPIPIIWTLQSLGFLIGFAVVRDVRWAAHSTIIEKVEAAKQVPVPPAGPEIRDIAAARAARSKAA
jgi:hypothetical protein